MKIGVFIPYHQKLTKYLDAVKSQFPKEYDIEAREYDFKVTAEEDARNEGLDFFAGYDAVFTIDADEFILREDQEKLIHAVVDKKKDSAFISVLDYSDGLHIYPMRAHRPVVLVNPSRVRFYDGRCLRFQNAFDTGEIFLHHFGYTFSPEKMQWKSDNYWDRGNPKGIIEVMRREPVPYQMPEEIKNYVQAA